MIIREDDHDEMIMESHDQLNVKTQMIGSKKIF